MLVKPHLTGLLPAPEFITQVLVGLWDGKVKFFSNTNKRKPCHENWLLIQLTVSFSKAAYFRRWWIPDSYLPKPISSFLRTTLTFKSVESLQH